MGLRKYQWECFLDDDTPTEDLDSWKSPFGPVVVKRETVPVVKFTLLVDNPKTKVYLVGPFNNWGKDNIDDFMLQHDEHSITASLTLPMKHKTPYKFLVHMNGKKLFNARPSWSLL